MSDQPETNAGPTRSSQLNAPWRESWIMHLAQQEAARNGMGGGRSDGRAGGDAASTPGASTPPAESGCFLRQYWLAPEDDATNHVIVRTGSPETGRGGMILLNAYPYVGGHLLVALGDGRPKLADYTPEQQQELWSLVTLAAELCEDVLNPQGLNIGMNVGRAAGAGVPEHLHAHVIPRWFGDVNFITTAGNVRLINASLDRFYEQYTACWDRVRETAGPDVGDG